MKANTWTLTKTLTAFGRKAAIATSSALLICSAAITPAIAESGSLLSESWLPGNSQSFTAASNDSQWKIQQFQQQFGDELKPHAITKLSYQQLTPGSAWHFSLSNTQDELHSVVGFTKNNITVSAMAGDAQYFMRDAGPYLNVDRYGFHGGNNHMFQFAGAAIDSQLADSTHLQFGFTRLDTPNSNTLDSRGARYTELSSGPVFARYTQLSRASDTIGYAIDTGVAIGNAEFAVQAMRTENDKQLTRFRGQYSLNNATELMFDMGHIDNPLHYNDSQYTVLLTLKHVFGKTKFAPLAVDKTSTDPAVASEKAKKKRRINRPLIIGAGVVAAAAIASSGSKDSDNSARGQNERQAAFNVLNSINPTSVKENREHGGWIYRNPDNTYSSTSPVAGDNDSVLLPDPNPIFDRGGIITANYHTHAAFDPRYDNENFSPTDLNLARRLNINAYLGTPGGAFKFFNGSSISTLGTIAN